MSWPDAARSPGSTPARSWRHSSTSAPASSSSRSRRRSPCASSTCARSSPSPRRRGIPVACDSTWGTPRYFDAHGLGIDISIHAATKYIGGHSDIMLGLTTGSHDALASTRAWCVGYGSTVAPDVCWLGLRGLRTLSVRLRAPRGQRPHSWHGWLEEQPQVERVLYPALPSDPHHDLWRRSSAARPASSASSSGPAMRPPTPASSSR